MPILYTRNQCSACEQVKKLLNERGIAFQVVNIQESPEAATLLVDAGIRSVPVLEDANGERYVGASEIVSSL